MVSRPPLRLFEGFGVELEYMLVHRRGLDVAPAADELLRRAGGAWVSDVERGRLTWSNELVLHVIEFKSSAPAPALEGLAEAFQESVAEALALLEPMGLRLLPTAMHPWMDPARETRLWPGENRRVYRTFDRIFGCTGHGWANLQSAHLNLPFGDEEEFRRLHAAIRPLLPLLPALAASSPVVEGRPTGFLDTRLRYYKANQRILPSIAGAVVPEAVDSAADYRERILGRIYAEIAPLDPEGILRHEWLNSRGAIARFSRGSIEIRLLDIQEHPGADLAVLAAVSEAVRALEAERWVPLERLQRLSTERLAALLGECVRAGEAARVEEPELLAGVGLEPGTPRTAGEIWRHLAAELPIPGSFHPSLRIILEQGTLATRILRALGPDPSRARIAAVFERLAASLAGGEPFLA